MFDILKPALPELFKNDCPVAGVRGFLIRDYKSAHYLDEKQLGDDLAIERLEGLDKEALSVLVSQPSRTMWEHDGVCGCGRRTYLFGQCFRCLKEEAEEAENSSC